MSTVREVMGMRLRDAPQKVVAVVGAAVVVAGVGTFAAVGGIGNDASADTENCVTHDEYDRTDVFMTPSRIEEIYDVPGTFFDTDNPDTFARIYHNLCWTNAEEIKVVYDQQSWFSIRWRLLDK